MRALSLLGKRGVELAGERRSEEGLDERLVWTSVIDLLLLLYSLFLVPALVVNHIACTYA